MEQKLFKTKVVEELENKISENKEIYTNLTQNPNVIKELLESDNKPFEVESRLEIPKFELICGGAETDVENAKRIYEAFKELTSTQAVSKELWVYLTHVQFAKYMSIRWNANKNDDKTNINEFIKSRYFFSRGIKGTVRNGISRLWWAGKWGYDETRENPWELLEILLDKQETFLHVSERSFNLNKNILVASLLAIRDNRLTTPEIKVLYKKINAKGGLIPLDAFDKEDANKMVEEIVQEIVGNRKLKDKISIAIGVGK